MLTHGYSYEAALNDALKVNWRVEDLIGADKRLDFTKPLLPERLAQVHGISSLSPREKLLLNQIRGNSYLYLFGFVEEFILPFVLDEARGATQRNDAVEVRALATFAEEEAKHIDLFRRFAKAFAAGFGHRCDVVGPAGDVARAVLSHSRLGVALLTLHIEWMTQAHYLDSIKDDQDLDPQFKSMLRHHWQEESQHAKLDTLLVDQLASDGGKSAIAKAFEDYAALGAAIDGLLSTQAELDLVALERASGRVLSRAAREEVAAAQTRAYRYTFLVSGLLHPNFLATVEQLDPAAAVEVRAMAAALSA